ncbi:AAA family ATPase [Paraburkholderia sp. DHOC27]|uniref:trifunctional serine/threonine-protein kinase/ATP-binding protein/sensor histidine kinase n=1 Tax=Paraburkholderia sp. DHOC27 TaxID=2303330 RepID=UPI000E3BCC88|nr:AAA family ATPase [Paraburkholderia sp. DHOC27]RFU46655.1 GAF domain-containing protein [Paraburkholderia sp. DHOC27]
MNPSSWHTGNGESRSEVLWEDSERVVSRRWRKASDGHRLTVLEVVPVAEHASLATLNRLTHEYELKDALSESWSAQPFELVRERGGFMLVLNDPGGEPLDWLIGQTLPIDTFIRVAAAIASALAHLHECGLIHKDIKPTHILVDCERPQAWLSGFGITSRRAREQQSPEPPESIAGTLAYMAPEQTGRMNRSIDSRSDLYSLGVTLYQLLTGHLPFSAADPMEWVHCHIARMPVPPHQISGHVPPSVSAIVMKLLAKTAEDRYQTALGVESDLRRCLTEWETRRRFKDFLLGEADTPDRLLIPEKLYGRTAETATLLASFNRVITNGTPELVLVSGYSGVGKSSVVSELHKALVPLNGLFASGKFDQYKRDIPYTTLAQALQSLVHPLLSKSEDEFSDWRAAIQEAVGPNARLIFDLVPELKLILGEQPPVPVLPAQDAQRRFQRVFRRFIGVFARPEHPLALFLDDLQWLDAATLDLLENLLTQPDLRHLLLIGAYRNNEVDAAHPLMRKLDAIREAGAQVQEIVLGPLSRQDLEQLTGDALRCEPERAASLAQLLHEKTEGNPFFVIQFLSSLADEALVDFDHRKARWTWDLKRIHAKGYTDNVVDLMVAKLSRLPAETQAVLQQLACLGSSASVAVLALVCQLTEDHTHAHLREAVRSGLVLQSDSAYRFLHDRVQEGAYSFIPAALRAATHLRIGRLLAAHTPAASVEEAIFEIVSQLNRGAALVTSNEERERIAALNLIAGQRAQHSTAYDAALTYLSAGRAILPEDCWQRCSALTFALELHRAECEFLTGALAQAEERLSILSTHARRLVDLAAVAQLREELYTTLGRSDRAIEVCLDYLQRVGVHWSANPTTEEVNQEYAQLWQQLSHRAIQDLIDLPLMTDPEWRATMDVLTAVVSPALFTNANLLCLVVCRMANLSLQYGNCDGSCFAYAWLGMILGAYFRDYQNAFRFGKLGLDLVEQRGLRRFEARVYLIFGHRVLPWTQPIHTGRPLVLRAFAAANQLGDLTFAAYSRDNLITNLLASGEPLADVQREAEAGLEFARQAHFGLVTDRLTSQIRLIKTLRGLTPDFASFNDAEFDEARFERHLQSEPQLAMASCWYWIRKLQARFLAGDPACAIAAAACAERLLWTAPSFFEMAEYHFYAALAHAAMYDAASPEARGRHLDALVVHHLQLREWADACPENFANRATLVEGEMARVEGRQFDAMQRYEQAICSARANGFVHNEALANEVAARFYAAHGLEKIARNYLQDAHHGYLRWGADAKARQLEQTFPRLKDELRVSAPTVTIGSSVENLELATLIKVSQAVSSEIVLDNLLDALMRTAVEQAGAERGVLIVPGDGELLLAAQATVSGAAVHVQVCERPLISDRLPESVLHYVMRTHESVMLDDAAQSSFAADPYIQQHQSRSLLLLPLLAQAKLIGALYLENSLATGVFGPARVAVLKLLASQAAIALENARLYRDLAEREAKIRRLVDANIVGICIYDLEGRILEANDAFLQIVRYDRDDLAAGRIHWTHLTPGERTEHDRHQWLPELLAMGTLQPFEKECMRKDGSRVPVLIGAASFEEKTHQGVAFLFDLSDHKHAEAAARESEQRYREVKMELAHANRASTMGQLAASIAHEVKQPITAVAWNASGALRWLGAQRPNVPEALQALERIRSDAKRASEIVDRIRDFIKKAPPHNDSVDIAQAVGEVIELTRGEAVKHGISVQAIFAKDLPLIRGDRVQLQQVVLNLIMNAIEAMSTTSEGPRELRIETGADPLQGIVIAVADSGPGLPADGTDRLFDPFYSTKASGLGMGLSICRSIVEAHGGILSAKANAPRGAVFYFNVADRAGAAT